MMVEDSQQETLDTGFVLHDTRQQGVSVILRELVLPDGFEPQGLNITIITLDIDNITRNANEDYNNESSNPQLTDIAKKQTTLLCD
ncbi:unnamed protein product [Schistosoma curassoni]|uniref:Cadherin domain-containing protein n=1 Tax=Schistosoma curassoni TaxID=6186 RepID=A0A183KGL0_9TREM|nr:unnamed protein product [Schistosoma curassoni]